MNGPFPVVYLARVVLETRTPLSISTGSPDGVFDTALVRDANGLPAVPGTSLAGKLRHLYQSRHGESAALGLFGYQAGNQGHPSRASVSWGALMDSHGRPAEGLLTDQEQDRLEDSLYQAALAQIDAPVFRNRVRIGHRGAAADRAKFDRAVLPAGNRFALELRLRAPSEDGGSDWTSLLGLLAHPGLRLGGGTRAGLGSVSCVSLYQGRFDLGEPEAVAAFGSLGRGLTDIAGLEPFEPQADLAGWVTGILRLKARGFWRIGQGDPDPNKAGDGKPADLLPVTEERVLWKNGRGERAIRALLFPASSLKGALAHRMAYHANRFGGRWAEETAAVGDPTRPVEVQSLLGSVKEKGSNARLEDTADGLAGCMFLDDAFVSLDPGQVAQLMHNAIDRFTGGVRDRVLYEEECLVGGAAEIPLALDLDCLKRRGDIAPVRRALSAALADLLEGRIGLGSRTTTGHGFFAGVVEGPLGQWLEAADPATGEEGA